LIQIGTGNDLILL